MVDGGVVAHRPGEGTLTCDYRFADQRALDYHIQAHHTTAGLAQKLRSETQLARCLDRAGIAYTRDWQNRLRYADCPAMARIAARDGSTAGSSRPDFHLLALSARLGAIVLLGNDEFEHRRYKCDLKRCYEIATCVGTHPAQLALPILYVRFNPHWWTVDGVHHDLPLDELHARLLRWLAALPALVARRPLVSGMNLAYLNYSRTDGVLDLFAESEGGTYAGLLRDIVWYQGDL